MKKNKKIWILSFVICIVLYLSMYQMVVNFRACPPDAFCYLGPVTFREFFLSAEGLIVLAGSLFVAWLISFIAVSLYEHLLKK